MQATKANFNQLSEIWPKYGTSLPP